MSTIAATRSSAVLPVLASAALAVVGTLAAGITPALLLMLYVAAITPELVRIDRAERRLPNRIVIPGYGIAAVALTLQWAITATPPVVPVVAGIGTFAVLFVLAIVGGMGMGDVKLGGVLGLAAGSVGITAAVLSLVMAFVLGGMAALLALHRGSRTIPFGPSLLAGFWVAIALAGAADAAGVSVG